MAARKADFFHQIGPFFGNVDDVSRMIGCRVEAKGFPWWRITMEGRMILVEGWTGSPPEVMPLVPEPQGRLPEGWRA